MAKGLPVSRRRQKRERVWLSGRISGEDWAQEVRVRDLSATGALLESDLPPPLGCDMWLSCGEVQIEARVAWVGNHCVGIIFRVPIDPEALARRIGPVLRVSAPRGHRGAAIRAG